MLHDPNLGLRKESDAHYADINDWWRGPGTCINGSWKKFQKAVEADKEKKKVREAGEKARPELSNNNNNNVAVVEDKDDDDKLP